MTNHKITREDLEGVANKFLTFLKKEEISSVADLEKRVGKSYPKEGAEEFIQIQRTLSGRQ